MKEQHTAMFHSPEATGKMISCILLQRITEVPCLYFPTFNHRERLFPRVKEKDSEETDRWTDGAGKEMSVRCPWESGP